MVPISCTKELITIVGTNTGGRTAVIGEPVLFVVKNKQEKSRIELISSDKDFSLKPGDVKIIEYTASSAGVAGADFPTRSQGEKCQLLISFPIIDFQEEGMNFPVYCDCPLER
jgi:hypothetical protein